MRLFNLWMPGLLLVCGLSQAQATSYYYATQQGTAAEYNFEWPGKIILFGQLDNVLSPWQPLPFDWDFFGRPVQGFYASDNGYISFNEQSSGSNADHHALPSASAPFNAIMALWHDLHLASGSDRQGQVRSWVYGAAPARVQVIQWRSMAPAGQTPGDDLYADFAIRLYEAGDFDIVWNRGQLPENFSAAVGAQNHDASAGINVDGGSAAMLMPAGREQEDDRVLSFHYGQAPERDLRLLALDLPEETVLGTEVPIRGRLVNNGRATVTAIRIVYQTAAGQPQSALLEGLSIAPHREYQLTHPQVWQADKAGLYKLELRITEVNGMPDEQPADNRLSALTAVTTGRSVPRRIVVEKFTGAWCGSCVDGVVVLDKIIAAFPDVLAAAIHFNDAMAIEAAQSLIADFAPAYPEASFNRIAFDGKRVGMASRSAWPALAEELAGLESVLELELKSEYAADKREVLVELGARFVDYAARGDLRLNVYVIEDGLVGEGPGWEQSNSMNNVHGHPYYRKGHPVVGFEHNHVLRAMPLGSWGLAGVIPAEPEVDRLYSHRFILPLAADWQPERISLLAFVAYHDSSTTRRQVLNSTSAPLINPAAAASETMPGAADGLAWNLSLNKSSLRLRLTQARNIQLTLLDIKGRLLLKRDFGLVAAGEHWLRVEAEAPGSGLYLALLQAGDERFVNRILVLK